MECINNYLEQTMILPEVISVQTDYYQPQTQEIRGLLSSKASSFSHFEKQSS